MKRAILPVMLAIIAALACACGRGGPPTFEYEHTAFAWAQRPDRQQLVDKTVAWALAYWGGSEADLDGWRFDFWDGTVTGAVTCSGEPAHGCAGDGLVLVEANGACPEVTPLAHEIGHVIIGDPGHVDPRWWRLPGVLMPWAVQQPECYWPGP